VRLAVEHVVRFTAEGCIPFDRVQDAFHLI
jgi:hypothetical protein